MHFLHPRQVLLEPHEVERSNRVRVAAYYGVLPGAIDDMPASDFEDTLAVLAFDDLKREYQQQKAMGRR